MKVLERIRLLADADVLDRLLENPIDRERRAASRIAIHLREDDARDAEPRIEALRDLHGVLAGHAIRDEQNLVGLDRLLELLELLHHLVVDLEATGGVDENDAIARAARLVDAVSGDLHDVLMPALGVHGNVELLAERLELVDRGRPIDIGGDESRLTAFGLELARQLGRRGRFPGALQADHHDDGRRHRAQLQTLASLAQHRGELVVDDLHQLLGGRYGLELRDADRLLLDALEELARQREVDVRLQEDATHLAEALLDVSLSENAASTKARKSGLEFFGKLVEHSLEA